MFIIMNTNKYTDKIDALLNDPTKFKKVTKYPTNTLKAEINKLISTINGESSCNITKISGHYEPGYIYMVTQKPINNK